jgi:hypothetical protein
MDKHSAALAHICVRTYQVSELMNLAQVFDWTPSSSQTLLVQLPGLYRYPAARAGVHHLDGRHHECQQGPETAARPSTEQVGHKRMEVDDRAIHLVQFERVDCEAADQVSTHV